MEQVETEHGVVRVGQRWVYGTNRVHTIKRIWMGACGQIVVVETETEDGAGCSGWSAEWVAKNLTLLGGGPKVVALSTPHGWVRVGELRSDTSGIVCDVKEIRGNLVVMQYGDGVVEVFAASVVARWPLIKEAPGTVGGAPAVTEIKDAAEVDRLFGKGSELGEIAKGMMARVPETVLKDARGELHFTVEAAPGKPCWCGRPDCKKRVDKVSDDRAPCCGATPGEEHRATCPDRIKWEAAATHECPVCGYLATVTPGDEPLPCWGKCFQRGSRNQQLVPRAARIERERVGDCLEWLFVYEPRVVRELGRMAVESLLREDARRYPAFATARRAAVLSMMGWDWGHDDERNVDVDAAASALSLCFFYEELRGGMTRPRDEADRYRLMGGPDSPDARVLDVYERNRGAQ